MGTFNQSTNFKNQSTNLKNQSTVFVLSDEWVAFTRQSNKP